MGRGTEGIEGIGGNSEKHDPNVLVGHKQWSSKGRVGHKLAENGERRKKAKVTDSILVDWDGYFLCHLYLAGESWRGIIGKSKIILFSGANNKW